MELSNFYNLDECIDRKLVIRRLKKLEKEGKLEYDILGDILKIDDIDLEDSDIDKLVQLFDENDVFEDTEYEESDGDLWGNVEDEYSDDNYDY